MLSSILAHTVMGPAMSVQAAEWLCAGSVRFGLWSGGLVVWWSVVCGLWSAVCGLLVWWSGGLVAWWSGGLWSVVCGLWSVVCGLVSFGFDGRGPHLEDGCTVPKARVEAVA